MESVIQTVMTMIILFGLCFIYLFYRLKLIQSGQSYTQQQNYLLQKKYEMAKASYQANAELYHDTGSWVSHYCIRLFSCTGRAKIGGVPKYL